MLLPNPRPKSRVALSQRQDGVLVDQLLENLKKREPQILVYPQWVEAFSVCVAAIGNKHPQFLPDLMAYQVLISEASAHGGARWLNYNREFREKVTAKKLRQWNECDPNLWAKFFPSATPKGRICQHYRSQDHVLDDCLCYSQQVMTSRPDLCITEKPKSSKLEHHCEEVDGTEEPKGTLLPFEQHRSLLFPHVCQNCGEEHSVRVCPSAQQKVGKRGYSTA